MCRILAAALVLVGTASPSRGQVVAAEVRPPEAVKAAASGEQSENAGEGGGVHAFLRDVWSDYRNFISVENAEWAVVGAVGTLVVHSADDMIREKTAAPTPFALKPGSAYGNLSFQFPLALTWWVAGQAAGSARGSNAGRDLVRAQISALSWTYAIKYAVARTRPNGDPRSFPSGHASATFATAMVLHRHYGWKLGVPMFVGAIYTAAERITENKHWASDVAFGAVVGMLAGRTVTLHLREQDLQIEPQAIAGGGVVTVRVLTARSSQRRR